MPTVFWITFFSLPLLLFWLTLAGAAWVPLFPWRLRAGVGFYLSPALGLASFTLAATVCGWLLPFARAWPWLALLMLLMAALGWRGTKSVQHAFWVALFGLVCSASLLAPLAVYGSFNNPFNDALTYLQHSQWLQQHAFSDAVLQIKPENVQVMLYQESRLRMGASFVLAAWQAILHIEQPFDVYSGVMGVGLSVVCLAQGLPLMRLLRPLPQYLRFLVLSLPALTLGGLVFGANAAFMPQTIGLALAAPALFVIGDSLQWLLGAGRGVCPNGPHYPRRVRRLSAQGLWQLALPAALMLSAAMLAYSELAPFLVLALLSSIALLWLRAEGRVQRRAVGVYGMALFLLLGLILNAEIVRMVAALRLQVGAVVGIGVPWSMSGFVGHAFGLHGGIWDTAQWSVQRGSWAFVLGWILLALPLLGLWKAAGSVWRGTWSGLLLPCMFMLAGLALALLIFRYVATNPFPVGTGQSWSQFKLSEWAHPFVMLLVIWAGLCLYARQPRRWRWLVCGVWLFGLGFSSYQGAARLQPFMANFPGVYDMRHMHQQLSLAVERRCSPQATLYFDVGLQHVHYRQMAVVFFGGRGLNLVHSDWRSDPYFARLPQQNQPLALGNCVIESGPNTGHLLTAEQLGPFRVGTLRPDLDFVMGAVTGAYQRESDATYWWYWIEHKADFTFNPMSNRQGSKVGLHFQYMAHTPQQLYLSWKTISGEQGGMVLPKTDSTGQWLKVDQILPVDAQQLKQISLETDAVATRLGEQDARLGAFAAGNFVLQAVVP